MNIEYTIVVSNAINMSTTLCNLQREVENCIKEGWKPIGGVCMVTDKDVYYATQSMIKES